MSRYREDYMMKIMRWLSNASSSAIPQGTAGGQPEKEW